MRRAGEIALLVAQWVLLAFGIYLIAATLRVYFYGADLIDQTGTGLVKPLFYSPMTDWEMSMGVGRGFIAVGLAGTLFYLRRVYLSRQQ